MLPTTIPLLSKDNLSFIIGAEFMLWEDNNKIIKRDINLFSIIFLIFFKLKLQVIILINKYF